MSPSSAYGRPARDAGLPQSLWVTAWATARATVRAAGQQFRSAGGVADLAVTSLLQQILGHV